jgi:hypothetical protein
VPILKFHLKMYFFLALGSLRLSDSSSFSTRLSEVGGDATFTVDSPERSQINNQAVAVDPSSLPNAFQQPPPPPSKSSTNGDVNHNNTLERNGPTTSAAASSTTNGDHNQDAAATNAEDLKKM